MDAPVFFFRERRQAFFGAQRVRERPGKVVVHQHAEFAAFCDRRFRQLSKSYIRIIAFCIKCRLQHSLFDVAAADFELLAQKVVRDIGANRRIFRNERFEEPAARRAIRHREINAVADTTLERIVEVGLDVRRQHRHAFEIFHIGRSSI